MAKTPVSKKTTKAPLDKPTVIKTAKPVKAGKAKAPAQPAKRGADYHAYRSGNKIPKKMRLPKGK